MHRHFEKLSSSFFAHVPFTTFSWIRFYQIMFSFANIFYVSNLYCHLSKCPSKSRTCFNKLIIFNSRPEYICTALSMHHLLFKYLSCIRCETVILRLRLRSYTFPLTYLRYGGIKYNDNSIKLFKLYFINHSTNIISCSIFKYLLMRKWTIHLKDFFFLNPRWSSSRSYA